MKINKKAGSIMVIVLGAATVCLGVLALLNYVPIDIAMIFLGCTQLVSGISQMRMAQELDSKGEKKDTKKVGRFSVIIGLTIVVLVIFKMIIVQFI
ncbi:hypothetical protein [Cellulosilyticum sp. I15G10I2]|uniref:hypothetical protein n=1 Tax=Cellulosilyticum sp. I15G10I2 TaxID=1892843 RepID=UPI00085C89A2|nr:hypothetical protein [Cellulosilyticum sp. I15G10I2]